MLNRLSHSGVPSLFCFVINLEICLLPGEFSSFIFVCIFSIIILTLPLFSAFFLSPFRVTDFPTIFDNPPFSYCLQNIPGLSYYWNTISKKKDPFLVSL